MAGNIKPYSTIQNVNGINQNWRSSKFGSWGQFIDFLNDLKDDSNIPIFFPPFTVNDNYLDVQVRVEFELGIVTGNGCTTITAAASVIRPDNKKC